MFPTTKGEQEYAYLYAGDFARAIVSVIGKKDKSGIYNLSSSHLIALKALLQTIRRMMHSDIELKLDALPYRENQSMLICGNSDSFIQQFGHFERTTLDDGLANTIAYYINKEE